MRASAKCKRSIGTFVVTVDGFGTQTYSARSRAAARSEAWRNFLSAFEISFRDFLSISKVQRCAVPSDDGYGYVRRAYKVNVRIGDRVRVINEGRLSGSEGEVVYPGQTTAHVHVALDDNDSVSIIHPLSIEPLEGSAAP